MLNAKIADIALAQYDMKVGYALKKKFYKVMLFSSFVWIISNFHHPVTPTYFTSLGLPNHIFGTSYAMMVFTSFLTAPIWGSWGDNNSRIKTLTLSTFIYGLSQIGFAFVTSFWGIMFFRATAGIASGGYSVGLMAAIVDTSEPENRSVAMANYSALMSVSFAIGFLIGGALGYFSPQVVFIIQGILMLLVSLGFRFIVGETNEETKGKQDSKVVFIWDILRDAKKSKEIFSSWIIIFLIITFFSYIASGSNVNAFNYYLKERLNLKPIVNGIWKAITGIIGLIANLTINVYLIRNTNIKKSLIGLLSLLTLSAIMIILNTSFYPFMIWNLVFFTLHTILVPILQNFAIHGHQNDIGLMSGIYNAVKALGEMFGSIIAGFAYNISSMMPFILTAISVSIATLFIIIENLKDAKANN